MTASRGVSSERCKCKVCWVANSPCERTVWRDEKLCARCYALEVNVPEGERSPEAHVFVHRGYGGDTT